MGIENFRYWKIDWLGTLINHATAAVCSVPRSHHSSTAAMAEHVHPVCALPSFTPSFTIPTHTLLGAEMCFTNIFSYISTSPLSSSSSSTWDCKPKESHAIATHLDPYPHFFRSEALASLISFSNFIYCCSSIVKTNPIAEWHWLTKVT